MLASEQHMKYSDLPEVDSEIWACGVDDWGKLIATQSPIASCLFLKHSKSYHHTHGSIKLYKYMDHRGLRFLKN